MEEPLLFGLPSVAAFKRGVEQGEAVADTFTELRGWLRRASASGDLDAAGRLLEHEYRRIIFRFLRQVAMQGIRRNLAREALATMLVSEDWCREGADEDEGGTTPKEVDTFDWVSLPCESRGSAISGAANAPAPAVGPVGDMGAAEATPATGSSARIDTHPLPNQALCLICTELPAVATFVHGATGHTACCLACAQEVQRRQETCPVCRQRFSSVIRNFTA